MKLSRINGINLFKLIDLLKFISIYYEKIMDKAEYTFNNLIKAAAILQMRKERFRDSVLSGLREQS